MMGVVLGVVFTKKPLSDSSERGFLVLVLTAKYKYKYLSEKFVGITSPNCLKPLTVGVGWGDSGSSERVISIKFSFKSKITTIFSDLNL